MEFGLRRAQGADAAILGARAAVIGGCTGTSNVYTGQYFNIPVCGTHAHSWVMSFPDELTAFRAYAELFPDSCLLLVGEGELWAELEAKAARLGIAQDVKFLGVQSDTSVWYQAMDVFVMPSLFEGLPVVGMEAQASGLPCVFSTGVTEEVLLRPDSCRISLEQPDEAWAAVLKDADRNLPDRAQAAAQVRAAGYDIRQETLRLQQLYTGLIAKRGAAHA